VPLKMQSAMRSARSDLWLCSPKTHEIASTTLDLPQPFGPTMQVVPIPLNVTTVRSQNDLNPVISTFRSLSKVAPFISPSSVVAIQQHRLQPVPCSCISNSHRRKPVLLERPGRDFRGEGVAFDHSAPTPNVGRCVVTLIDDRCLVVVSVYKSTGSRSPVKTFGRFSIRGPAAWRAEWRYGKKD
jgi:hypothetical protein